ncbi:MAG: Nicotinate-nucleotide adenylyltransferase [Chlamydiae bacterium]|nr:Nicotinate-nucleotide adenylyltransferase [Chlamydiota bacterium]
MTRKKIGLFGGTFNPIHFGHLNLALEIQEKKGLDEVWVIPAHLSPLRVDHPLIPAFHRLKMVELACAELKGFSVLDWEINRPPPSYTSYTLEEIKKKSPKHDFFLLLGEDALIHFDKWKNPEQILAMASPLIAQRVGQSLEESLSKLTLSDSARQKLRSGLVSTRILDISATEIRERIQKKLYFSHLVPAKVVDYIYDYQLYCNLNSEN